jgi:hypothetical protein
VGKPICAQGKPGRGGRGSIMCAQPYARPIISYGLMYEQVFSCLGQSTACGLDSNPQLKMDEMVRTTYHQRLSFWFRSNNTHLSCISEVSRIVHRQIKFYFHISRASHIISSALLKAQCEVIHQLVCSETTGGKPNRTGVVHSVGVLTYYHRL